MDPVNFDPADPMVTPAHIYPEWYFLWSYEVLRGFFFDIAGIKAFDIGLIAFAFANGIFFVLPWLDRDNKILPAHKRPLFFIWFWLLVVDLIVLTVYGKLPPTGANAWVGFFAAVAFILLFVLLPVITKLDQKKKRVKDERIKNFSSSSSINSYYLLGVEPFAHSQMHPHVDPVNYNFEESDRTTSKEAVEKKHKSFS